MIDTVAELGLWPLTHPHLPSMVAHIAGGPVRGSWWGHPRGREIFNAASALGEHPDCAVLPLIDGRQTFVHRRLFPDVAAVGLSLGPAPPGDGRALAKGLWVVSEEVHGARGHHERVLSSWQEWCARRGVTPAPDASAARARLEAVARRLGPCRLPWTLHPLPSPPPPP